MKVHSNPVEAVNEITDELSRHLQSVARHLLETKHIYQTSSVDFSSLLAQHRLLDQGHHRRFIVDRFSNVDFWPWYLELRSSISESRDLAGFPERNHVTWVAPDFKTYCKTCKRNEPYNASAIDNLLNKSSGYKGGITSKAGLVEYYVLTYVCQSCKGAPEVFVIRRAGVRLALVGRGPMEQVDVPKEIPTQIATYYSNAVVAYQSGQALSAIFMLRTLIEQWARLFATSTDKADSIFDEYMDTLPLDFRARFPSLKDLYWTLSAAMHLAEADEALFESSILSITKHFRARETWELEGPAKRS